MYYSQKPLAESARFELASRHERPSDYKAGALNHSANSPLMVLMIGGSETRNSSLPPIFALNPASY